MSQKLVDILDNIIKNDDSGCFTGEIFTEVPEEYRMSAEEQARIIKETQDHASRSAVASLLSEYEASRFATD